MKNKIVLIISVIILLIFIFLVSKQKIIKESVQIKSELIATPTVVMVQEVTPILTAIKEKKVYKSNIVKSQDGVSFHILKNGKEIFSEKVPDKINIFSNTDGNYNNLPEIGQDIDGDKKPDFVLQLKSEKDGCSNIFKIYSIDNNFKKKAELKGLADGIKFKDMDGDEIPEIIGHDCTFLNWWASFGENLAPQIILKLKYGEYHLAESLMRKLPPSDEEIEKYIKSNKSSFITYIWEYMLELIYSGNGDLAWNFYEKVDWDPEWEENIMESRKGKTVSNKKEFLEAFKEHLTTSPYWEDLKELNNWEMLEVEM